MSQARTFDEIETRLTDITEAVSDESTSLDEALTLFEEAVKLGLEACEITETEAFVTDDEPEAVSEKVPETPASDEEPSVATGSPVMIEESVVEIVEVSEGDVPLA